MSRVGAWRRAAKIGNRPRVFANVRLIGSGRQRLDQHDGDQSGRDRDLIAERGPEMPEARRSMILIVVVIVLVIVSVIMIIVVSVVVAVVVMVIVMRSLGARHIPVEEDDRIPDVDVIGMMKRLMQRRREDRAPQEYDGRRDSEGSRTQPRDDHDITRCTVQKSPMAPMTIEAGTTKRCRYHGLRCHQYANSTNATAITVS